MGMLARIVDRMRGKSTETVGQELLALFNEWGFRTSAGIHVNSHTALQVTAVMACVSILSEDVAKLPPIVYRRLPKGGKVAVKASEHYLARLLRTPNDWQTRFEWLECMMAALLLRGNGYSVIIRDWRGQPEQLVPVHPDRVSLYEAPDGSWFFTVSRSGMHEMAVLKDMPLMIPAEDMFHVRWLASGNTLLGQARVQLMREAIGVAASQEQHAAKMLGNGARPSGALKTASKLSQPAYDRLKTEWVNNYGGLNNAGKVAILEEGLSWEPLGMNSVDAEFMASRQFQLEDMARGFRMPPHKLGITTRGSGTVLVQQDQDYLNNVITSYLERFEPKLEALGDLDGEEYFVEFDVSRFLRADMQTRYNAYRTGIVGVFLTPNEIRAAEGLAPVKGGDVLLQPVNMAPLGFVPSGAPGGAGGPGSDMTGGPGDGGDGDPAAVPAVPDDSAPAS